MSENLQHPNYAETSKVVVWNPEAVAPAQKLLLKALKKLVVDNKRTGQFQILASARTEDIAESHYATPFARDSVMLVLGLLDAIDYGKGNNAPNICRSDIEPYLLKAISALDEIASFQAKKDDPTSGVKRGQGPHEMRFPSDSRYEEFLEMGWRVYNKGGTNECIVNHDSSESSHLFVLAWSRLEKLYPGFLSEGDRSVTFRLFCDYILENSREHDGHAGFTNNLPWHCLEERKEAYGGLTEKGEKGHPCGTREDPGLEWREMRDEGRQDFRNGLMPMPGKPISGLQTTATKFAAEMMAADYYEAAGDEFFAAQLRHDARRTKELFNDDKVGFLRKDIDGKHYFVEAIAMDPEDRQRKQIPWETGAVIYALNFTYSKQDTNGTWVHESVIDNQYIDEVKTFVMERLFQPDIGVTTYPKEQNISTVPGERRIISPIGIRPTNYWIANGEISWSPDQYNAAMGLLKNGSPEDAAKVVQAASKIFKHFGSIRENWTRDEQGKIVPWAHFDEKHPQVAGKDMAFGTAMIGAVAALQGYFQPYEPTLPNKNKMLQHKPLAAG